MPSLQGFHHVRLFKVLAGLAIIACLNSCGSDEPNSETSLQKQPSVTVSQPRQSVARLETREAELQAAMEKPPVDLDLVYELATVRADLAAAAYRRGEVPLALDLLTNSLSIDPLNPDNWELLGDWSLALNIPDSKSMAHYAYTQAVDLRPHLPQTLKKLAAVCVSGGKYADGIKLYEKALSSPQAITTEWADLVLLVQLYIHAKRTDRGMVFLYNQFEETYDDRYLLALAAMMDAVGESGPAAEIARSVAGRTMIPEPLRQYAENLARRFATSGDKRLNGQIQADRSWRAIK